MTALITCAGRDVQRGRISLGLRGAWWAELEMDGDTAPTGTATIAAAGGLSLTGTITASGVFLLNTHVRLVGGAGGLATPVTGAFQYAQLSDPLQAILSAAGEAQSSSIASDVLAVPLPNWTLGERTAAAALDDLAAAATAHLGTPIGWRVLSDGSIWMGAETWPAQSLSDGSVIAEQFPAEGRTVIGCETPALLPGVNLDGIGNIVGCDHWISSDRIRSELTIALDPIERLRLCILAVLGLDYVGAPRIDRLALYRARVDAAASNGATVDVTPESARLSPMKAIPMRYAPGCVAVVEAGAVVLLGWEAGDPARIYAVPHYEAGATFSKIVIAGTTVYLGAEAGAQFVALENLVTAQFDTLKSAISGAAVVPNDGGAALKANIIAALSAWPGSVAASQTKAK